MMHLICWTLGVIYPVINSNDALIFFFAVYLPSFLSDHLGLPINSLIIPEFPVKVAAEPGKPATYRSKKIDYVALSVDRSRALFIELKTDCGSRNTPQNNYLVAAQKTGLNKLLQDLKEIAGASTATRKYAHLFRELASLALVQLPAGFVERLSQDGTNGIASMIDATRIVAPICSIEIYFFQPRLRPEDESQRGNILTFDAFAAWLSQQNDPLAVRFAQSVKRWSFDAGNCAE